MDTGIQCAEQLIRKLLCCASNWATLYTLVSNKRYKATPLPFSDEFIFKVCLCFHTLQGLQCLMMEDLVRNLLPKVIFTFNAAMTSLRVTGLSAPYDNTALIVLKMLSNASVSILLCK